MITGEKHLVLVHLHIVIKKKKIPAIEELFCLYWDKSNAEMNLHQASVQAIDSNQRLLEKMVKIERKKLTDIKVRFFGTYGRKYGVND